MRAPGVWLPLSQSTTRTYCPGNFLRQAVISGKVASTPHPPNSINLHMYQKCSAMWFISPSPLAGLHPARVLAHRRDLFLPVDFRGVSENLSLRGRNIGRHRIRIITSRGQALILRPLRAREGNARPRAQIRPSARPIYEIGPRYRRPGPRYTRLGPRYTTLGPR